MTHISLQEGPRFNEFLSSPISIVESPAVSLIRIKPPLALSKTGTGTYELKIRKDYAMKRMIKMKRTDIDVVVIFIVVFQPI